MDPRPIAVVQPTATKSSWRKLRPLLGYLLAAACLVWVFHGVHPRRLLASLTGLHWGWVALAIVVDILSYICQGFRWQLLLRPVGRASVGQTTEAIYVGLFANEVLPMRIGELVRGYLISRRLSAPFVASIPSIAVERLFDAVWLAVGIGLTAIFVPLPKNLLEAGDILGIIVLGATALFVYAVLRRQKAPEHSAPGDNRRRKSLPHVGGFLSGLARGLRQIGFSRYLYLSFGASFFVLLLQALALWLVMRAYGLHLSFWVGAAVLLVVHLGTAIPNAPANVGTYQFFVVVGLALFGVDKTLATGFSIVVFVLLTVPLWVLGFWALGRTGTTLAAIRQDITRLTARPARSG